jgi:hypothetical protein
MQTFTSLQLKNTAVEGMILSKTKMTYFYKSTTDIPVLVLVSPTKIMFINLNESKTFGTKDLNSMQVSQIAHGVRNGKDYTVVFSINSGTILVFVNGEYKSEINKIHIDEHNTEKPSLVIFNDNVLIMGKNSSLKVLKFERDNLKKVDTENEDNTLPNGDRFEIVKFEDTKYIAFTKDNNHTDIYTIEANKLKLDHTIETPKMINSITYTNKYFYTRDKNSIYRYLREKVLEKVIEFSNEEKINDFKRFNKDTIIVDCPTNIYLVDIENKKAQTIMVKPHLNLAVFDEYVAIVEFADDSMNKVNVQLYSMKRSKSLLKK